MGLKRPVLINLSTSIGYAGSADAKLHQGPRKWILLPNDSWLVTEETPPPVQRHNAIGLPFQND